MTEQNELKREFEDIFGLDCEMPMCNNTGCYATADEHGDPEPNQCEFCYCEPRSKFNFKLGLEQKLKEEHQKGYNQARKDWGFDD